MSGSIEIQKVGVIGAGTMGHGIAQVCAMAGCEVVLQDVEAAGVERGLEKIRANLQKGVDRGKVEAQVMEDSLARLSGTTELALAASE